MAARPSSRERGEVKIGTIHDADLIPRDRDLRARVTSSSGLEVSAAGCREPNTTKIQNQTTHQESPSISPNDTLSHSVELLTRHR